MIVNVSPTMASAHETLCSLRFANQVLTESMYSSHLHSYFHSLFQVSQVELGKASKNIFTVAPAGLQSPSGEMPKGPDGTSAKFSSPPLRRVTETSQPQTSASASASVSAHSSGAQSAARFSYHKKTKSICGSVLTTVSSPSLAPFTTSSSSSSRPQHRRQNYSADISSSMSAIRGGARRGEPEEKENRSPIPFRTTFGKSNSSLSRQPSPSPHRNSTTNSTTTTSTTSRHSTSRSRAHGVATSECGDDASLCSASNSRERSIGSDNISCLSSHSGTVPHSPSPSPSTHRSGSMSSPAAAAAAKPPFISSSSPNRFRSPISGNSVSAGPPRRSTSVERPSRIPTPASSSTMSRFKRTESGNAKAVVAGAAVDNHGEGGSVTAVNEQGDAVIGVAFAKKAIVDSNSCGTESSSSPQRMSHRDRVVGASPGRSSSRTHSSCAKRDALCM